MFVALTSGNVGTTGNDLRLEAFVDGVSVGVLQFGEGYGAPTGLPVAENGLLVGMGSGYVREGDLFSITADPHADCFKHSVRTIPALGYWPCDTGPDSAYPDGAPALTVTGEAELSQGASAFGNAYTVASGGGHLDLTDGALAGALQADNLTVQLNLRYAYSMFTTYRSPDRTLEHVVFDQGGRAVLVRDTTDLVVEWGSESWVVPGCSVGNGRWYHVAVAFAGGHATVVVRDLQSPGAVPAVASHTFAGTDTDLSAQIRFGDALAGGHQWIGGLDEIWVYGEALTADELRDNALVDGPRTLPTAASTPEIVLSYNSPRGNHRQRVVTELTDPGDPLPEQEAPRGASLGLASIGVLTPGNVYPLHVRLSNPGSPVESARLYLELVDPEREGNNVVWSSEQAVGIPSGIEYVNMDFDPAATPPAGPLDEGRPYYLLATLTDMVWRAQGDAHGGNIIDQAMVAIVSGQQTDEGQAPSLHTSVGGIPAGAVPRGQQIELLLTVANTGVGLGEVLLDLHDPSITTSLSDDYLRLLPGQSVTIGIWVDTSSLDLGPQSVSVPVLTNDPQGIVPIVVDFDIEETGDGVVVDDVAGFPWRKLLYIAGPRTVGDIISFDLAEQFNDPSYFPVAVYLRDEQVARGPFTRGVSEQAGVFSSTLKPKRISFRIPEDIAADARQQFRLDMGRRGTFEGGVASIPLTLPTGNLDDIGLTLLPVRQYVRPPVFGMALSCGETDPGNGIGSAWITDELRTELSGSGYGAGDATVVFSTHEDLTRLSSPGAATSCSATFSCFS